MRKVLNDEYIRYYADLARVAKKKRHRKQFRKMVVLAVKLHGRPNK